MSCEYNKLLYLTQIAVLDNLVVTINIKETDGVL